jgi:hypothetical protein
MCSSEGRGRRQRRLLTRLREGQLDVAAVLFIQMFLPPGNVTSEFQQAIRKAVMK